MSDTVVSYHHVRHGSCGVVPGVDSIRMTLEEYGFVGRSTKQEYPDVYVESCYYQAVRHVSN